MIRFRSVILLALSLLVLSACDSATDESQGLDTPKASVRVAEVSSGSIQTWLFAEGTARAIEREFLSFESAGRISYVDPALKEGDSVSQGQTIAYQQQDRPQAEVARARAGVIEAESQKTSAEASLEEAEASLEVAENTYQRFQNLIEKQSASQQELEDARIKLAQARAARVRAQRQLANATHQIGVAEAQVDVARIIVDESRIVSPIDGVLARLNIEQGFYFSPQQIQATSESGALNTVPVVIIDSSAFEISVKLPSYVHGHVAVGAQVLLQPGGDRSAIGGPDPQATETPSRSPEDFSIRGEVFSVSPSVDPETRTFTAKVRTIDGAERLQDGEFLTAWIAGPRGDNDPLVPNGVSRYDNNQPYAFRVDPVTNKVSRVEVTLGLRGRDHRQVLEGLTTGDYIVIEGHERLSDGDTVRIISEIGDGAGNL